MDSGSIWGRLPRVESLYLCVSSESQSSDEKKERKVLSLAQYRQSKKPSPSPPKTDVSLLNKLTDTEIEVINAQFNAATEKLAVNASDLANTVNKSLSQTEKVRHQHHLSVLLANKSTPVKTQVNDDLWAEADDDDDDDVMTLTWSSFSTSCTIEPVWKKDISFLGVFC